MHSIGNNDLRLDHNNPSPKSLIDYLSKSISKQARSVAAALCRDLAAFFNFITFLFFGLHVAQTVGTGIISTDIVDARVIFGALMGAISWDLITWWAGIPSNSSHALIGGLVGAGISKAGGGDRVGWADQDPCPRRIPSPGRLSASGAARKVSAVHWNVASNIVFAWIITLPAAALIAAAF